ncbi:MAG: hypothetical protein A2381_18650 [Bdellovibrionales bacterium RIFOXYB1_FULL_37_110]|nr:MAG: hypothetical protein A2417_01120 [Bdellovibrionales bacterium RIFOXYC1_FULL_37_79]OFZ59050.1 MAG: hypothetical protein A2381_18650 [Bdellovibrionales bacterium RIFOXYB1_FULL_37_110]OFZ65155.1 MAG: hypothetical protein A2577_04965 [Bdellovibrionales bacterium RIFOXYD1_FULL_36_51]
MTIINDFDYVRPTNLKEVFKLLNQNKSAMLLAGGTDLIGNLKEEVIKPKLLIDIKNIKGLNKIKYAKNELLIGALVTFDDLIHSQVILNKCPVVMEMAKTVASKAIRNRATMVGNICSAVPCMDSGAILMVYDARIVISDGKNEWDEPVKKWFKGPRKTILKKNQMVMGIKLPIPKGDHSGVYMKLGRYKGEDLAQATCAVVLSKKEGIKISFGSVAPTPVRALSIEKFLKNNELNEQTVNEIKKLVEKEISPIDDIRASKEYRMHMVKIMLERSLVIAKERLVNPAPAYGISHL